MRSTLARGLRDQLSARIVRPLLEAAAPRLGYSAVPNGPGSPLPALPPPGDPGWEYRYPPHSIAIDLDSQLAFLERELAPYVREFGEEVRDVVFPLWNGLYQAGDAEVLYALVRHLKPPRVLEIGSGNSTIVTSAACLANARDGTATEFTAVDPDPRRPVESLPGLRRYERIECQKLPFSRFEELQSGDVLFIDTTHVVKRGSEVNWLLLEALPLVKPGVWVHFHDIFLPYEYPFWLYWLQTPAEQYLLHALLLGGSWDVELALAALFVDRGHELTSLITSLDEAVPGTPELRTWYPSAFWIRRRSTNVRVQPG